MDDLDLQAHAMNKCQDLSGGTKRKLCAAIAMLGSPHLILMDEPTRYLLETLQDFFCTCWVNWDQIFAQNQF